jgi:hypothetical protein
MKAYTTLPRLVMAAVIIAVHAAGSESAPGFMADLTLDDGSKFSADGAMTIRHWPEPGDYLVATENPDGSTYHYLERKAVFEEKCVEAEVAVADDSDPLPSLDLGEAAGEPVAEESAS